MKKTVMDVLKKAGIDTAQYLSLGIDLPQGSEITIAVRDEETGELRPVTLKDRDEVYAFAEKSRYHGRLMADGHIFHPYIHRRFIAKQFRELIKHYGCHGILNAVATTRSWDYAIGVLRKEVHRLANLQKHDRSAFEERSRFFTLDCCRQIITQYVLEVVDYLDSQIERGDSKRVFIPGCGMMPRQNVRPMRRRFSMFMYQARACETYRQLDTLLSNFDWFSLPNNMTLPTSFVDPFVEEGAFYTLKYHMMQEGLRMWNKTQHESLAALYQYNGTYLRLYESLM